MSSYARKMLVVNYFLNKSQSVVSVNSQHFPPPLQWWRDESQGHLQASRSADRLHLPQPREISRKMSTNSEYAVITYA